jgi:hypothetical protein
MNYIVCFYQIEEIGVEVNNVVSRDEAIEKAIEIWRKDHAKPVVAAVEEVIK